MGKWRVAWKSKLTAYQGHGQYVFETKQAAQQVADEEDRKWADIYDHWVEQEPEIANEEDSCDSGG